MSIHLRHAFMVRSVATLTGDVAAGVALASACSWLIQAAALSVFLAFFVWLLGLFMSLAISQHVIHPTVQALLSDHKLTQAVQASRELAGRVRALLPARVQRA